MKNYTQIIFLLVLFFNAQNWPDDSKAILRTWYEKNDSLFFVGTIQWRVYSFSSLFLLAVATKSQKDHKLYSATYILCSKKNGQLKDRRPPPLDYFFLSRQTNLFTLSQGMKSIRSFEYLSLHSPVLS